MVGKCYSGDVRFFSEWRTHARSTAVLGIVLEVGGALLVPCWIYVVQPRGATECTRVRGQTRGDGCTKVRVASYITCAGRYGGWQQRWNILNLDRPSLLPISMSCLQRVGVTLRLVPTSTNGWITYTCMESKQAGTGCTYKEPGTHADL